ncbi:fasciclin-like arabinogalactan protein 13 [Oryza glaberrima]|uniref:FAS1 domain-containing protein n=1 Tax=Oryza glaberrima TaxID=4538 RepID=I1PXY2_ORYGL|nr:fasciclin-like arabinogalactan protein 13 [Oryza glaberrima]
MASSRLLLLAALLATAAVLAASQKPKAATPTKATPASPGPAAAAADGPAPTNVTAVLEKSGKYTTFLRLLHESRVDTQINSQLMDSYNGLTMFAPTDAAFAALKPGTLNSLSSQDQIQLMLYCVLPRFYSLAMLTTLGGPVNTQASGADGPYKYKIKPSNNNVNISTGVNWALLSTVVSKDFPLAVYSVDKVPLPYELFGPKPPTPAPAPAPAPSKSKTKKHKKSAGIAEPPVADDASADDTTKKAAAPATAVSRWVFAAAGVLAGAILAAL